MRAGFTLVEMLVVLAILGGAAAVVAMAIPRADSGADVAAAEYVAVLQRARIAALHRGVRVHSMIRTDASYEVRTGSSASGVVLEQGRSSACGSEVTVDRTTTHVMDPSGLVFGETTRFGCGDTLVSVITHSMEGRFLVAR